MDEQTAAAFRDLGNKIDKLPCRDHEGRISENKTRLDNGRDYEEMDLKKKAAKYSGFRVLLGICAVTITIMEFLARFIF